MDRRKTGPICSSTVPLTSALDWMGCQPHAPAVFTLGKETRSPLYRRVGGPQGLSRRVRKISPRPGFNRRTVQRVESSYSDWAIGWLYILKWTLWLEILRIWTEFNWVKRGFSDIFCDGNELFTETNEGTLLIIVAITTPGIWLWHCVRQALN